MLMDISSSLSSEHSRHRARNPGTTLERLITVRDEKSRSTKMRTVVRYRPRPRIPGLRTSRALDMRRHPLTGALGPRIRCLLPLRGEAGDGGCELCPGDRPNE